MDWQLNAMLAEFTKDCRHLVEHAEEAQKLFNDGNLDSVREIVSLSAYKISQATDDRAAILKHLEA